MAIPEIIEPKTKIISVKGGIKINKTLIQNFLSILPLYGTGGAILGNKKAAIKIYAI